MNPFAAGRSPFAVEPASSGKVPVSEFLNTARYSGGSGVSGLGAGTVYVPSADGKGWVAAGDAPTDSDVYAETFAEVWGNKASQMARSVGLPTWLGPVIGVGLLGVGGYFAIKAFKRR
ncbi:MAG: hypothetical protein WC700_18230 [Gemmatimonadaceae bacterium]|jgi:hypothetical protein